MFVLDFSRNSIHINAFIEQPLPRNPLLCFSSVAPQTSFMLLGLLDKIMVIHDLQETYLFNFQIV